MFRCWEHEVTGQENYHQICFPKSVMSQVLCALHNDPSVGHLGVLDSRESAEEMLLTWHEVRGRNAC